MNINEVPGYRIEGSPFGGVKDSGSDIKEGVIEAITGTTTVKTFSGCGSGLRDRIVTNKFCNVVGRARHSVRAANRIQLPRTARKE